MAGKELASQSQGRASLRVTHCGRRLATNSACTFFIFFTCLGLFPLLSLPFLCFHSVVLDFGAPEVDGLEWKRLDQGWGQQRGSWQQWGQWGQWWD